MLKTIIEFIDQLQKYNIFVIPIMPVILITNFLKNKFYIKLQWKSLYTLLTNVLLSCIIILPFIIKDFSISNYIKNVFVSVGLTCFLVDFVDILKKSAIEKLKKIIREKLNETN